MFACLFIFIMGAFIGDSAGAVLEFFRGKIKRKDVDKALEFEGGGALRVEPGQITDDSEMALCLMRGILNSNDGELNQDKLGSEYLRWYLSHPFDIGITTRRGMQCILEHFQEYENKDNLDILVKAIDNVNNKSDSNGCLMRATPLSVYWHKLSNEEIYKWTELDVNLTHTNPVAVYSVVCYNIAIAHLLQNFGDYEGAFKRVNDYVKASVKDNWKPFYNYWRKIIYAKEDRDVLIEGRTGWVIIAFSLAFYYLKNNYTYENAIKDTLYIGGDTDTNAAIVGGLVGARWGIDGIPSEWKSKGIRFDNFRQDFTELKDVNELEEMIENLVNLIFILNNFINKRVRFANILLIVLQEKLMMLLLNTSLLFFLLIFFQPSTISL